MSGAASSHGPAPSYARLTPSEQAAALDEIVARIAQLKPRAEPVLVFDLDGTLIDNRPRSAVIMQELAATWQDQHPEVSAKLRSARPDRIRYLFRENLSACGVCAEPLLSEAVSFWRARFFSDPFLCHDVPVAGALEFVRRCYDAGARVCYFSGRDLPNMALGSLASLRDLGFPIAVPGTELVLKPSSDMSDFEFKRELLPSLPRSGLIVAAFDNEPGHCNAFREAFPEARVFLVDTQHLPGAPQLDPAVSVIADFVS